MALLEFDRVTYITFNVTINKIIWEGIKVTSFLWRTK